MYDPEYSVQYILLRKDCQAEYLLPSPVWKELLENGKEEVVRSHNYDMSAYYSSFGSLTPYMYHTNEYIYTDNKWSSKIRYRGLPDISTSIPALVWILSRCQRLRKESISQQVLHVPLGRALSLPSPKDPPGSSLVGIELRFDKLPEI